MLSIGVASEAISLTDELLKNRAVLSALPGSPLAQLVNSCLNSEFVAKGNLSKEAFSPSVLSDLSKVVINDGKAEHDLVKAEIIDAVSKVIQSNRDMAKNVVVPLIKTIKERFDKLASDTGAEFIANIAIVQDETKEIWDHPVLDQLVEQYPDAALKVFSAPSALGPKLENAEDVAKLLVTGNNDIDALVNDIVKEDPMWLVNLYNDHFYQPSQDYTFDKVFNPYMGSRDAALVIFLIARHFMLNTPTGINYELSEYESIISDIVCQGANSIRNSLKIKVEERKLNRIVLNTPYIDTKVITQSTTIKIIVDPVTYNAFLQAGGTPEVILGACVVGGGFNYEKLLAEAQEYTSAYESYCLVRGEVLAQRKEAILVDSYSKTINEFIEELGDKADGPSKDQMRAVFAPIFAGINVHSFDDTYRLIRNTVCDVFFAHTDAKTILGIMDHLSVKFPEKAINEIASLALLDYITNWVKQFIVVKRLG